jgi:hypothetical protein
MPEVCVSKSLIVIWRLALVMTRTVSDRVATVV